MTKQRFSLVGLEKGLSALPWVMTFAIWLVVSGVLLFLYLVKQTEEMLSVVIWLAPLSFLVFVPGLGGFVCLLMRMRRSRLDTRLLTETKALLGGELTGPSLLLPVVRPRLLADLGGIPIEIVLSPPIPRPHVQAAVDLQQAASHLTIEQVERASESPDARLGTACWPQLELRLGADLPFKLHVSTTGSERFVAPGLIEVPVDDQVFTGCFRALSDEPEAAERLLAHQDLRTLLSTAMSFNHPWATQLSLRPASSGRGAGIYLVTVAEPGTSADSLVMTLEQLLEVARHPAWLSCTSSGL